MGNVGSTIENGFNDNIVDGTNDAINSIKNTGNGYIDKLNLYGNQAVSSIQQYTNSGISEIQNYTNSGISQIQNKTDEGLEIIQTNGLNYKDILQNELNIGLIQLRNASILVYDETLKAMEMINLKQQELQEQQTDFLIYGGIGVFVASALGYYLYNKK
jgi:hypothetical protein